MTDGCPGRTPFLFRRVGTHAKIAALSELFNSLGILQPGAINCPAGTTAPVVTISFDAPSGLRLAEATDSSQANQTFPATEPGWDCLPIGFSVLGQPERGLAGNVIAPIQRLLHIKLRTHG